MRMRTPLGLRVAVVQFSPKIGQVQDNVDTATRLCSKLEPRSVDLVCLPEMVFTGYVFPDAKSISPYLETPKTGPTSLFCSNLAKRLHCYVAAGYPERLSPTSEEIRPVMTPNKMEDGSFERVDQVGANSAVVFSPDGELVGNYRKTNLYVTDMTWAKPGTGFMTLNLPPPLNTLSLAICMDLNVQPPAIWTVNGPYEVADYCIAKGTNVLVLLNAWLDSASSEDQAIDLDTMSYWAERLRPLWEEKEEEEEEESVISEDKETIVIVCNRCGSENGVTFAGSSTMFGMRRGSGKPRVLRAMSRKQEGVEVWTA